MKSYPEAAYEATPMFSLSLTGPANGSPLTDDSSERVLSRCSRKVVPEPIPISASASDSPSTSELPGPRSSRSSSSTPTPSLELRSQRRKRFARSSASSSSCRSRSDSPSSMSFVIWNLDRHSLTVSLFARAQAHLT